MDGRGSRVRHTTGDYVFIGVCLLTGGLPHLHPIILPLLPCPFQRVPNLHLIILPLVPCPFWGVTQDRLGLPPSRVRMGYLLLGRTGVPTWPGQDGVPPWPGQDEVTFHWDKLCRGWYVSCDFPQEDCLIGSNILLLIFFIFRK